MYFNCQKYFSDCFDSAKGPFFDVVYRIRDFHGEDRNKYICSRMISGSPFGISNTQVPMELVKNQKVVEITYTDCGQVEKTWINDSFVCKNKDKVSFWKVALYLEVDWFSHPSGIIQKPIILKPWEVCTDKFVLMAIFHTEQEAKSFVKYLYTKFVRFLLFCSMDSSWIYPKTFEYVPFLNYSKEYLDECLYEMFDLREGQRYFIDNFFRDLRNC